MIPLVVQLRLHESDDDEHSWNLEDCIEFTQQWKSLDDMKNNCPKNTTQCLWKVLLDVYELSMEYGPDARHIYGHMEARAKGAIYQPDDDGAIKTPRTHIQNWQLQMLLVF